MICNDKPVAQGAACEDILVDNSPPCGSPPIYAPINFCLMGVNYSYDGVGWSTSGDKIVVPDGVYTSIAVQDGCIVGFGYAPPFTYTPPPCASSPCGGCSSCTPPDTVPTTRAVQSVSSGVVIDSSTDNILRETLNGYSAKIFYKTTPSVKITGAGTSKSPLAFEFIGGEGGELHGGAGLEVTTTNVGYTVAMKKVGEPSTYAGLSVNSYGQVTGYTAPDTPTITRIEAGKGISVVAGQAGSVMVSVSPSGGPADSYDMGKYSVTVTEEGLIRSLEERGGAESYTSTYIDYASTPPMYRTVAVEGGLVVDTLSERQAPAFIEDLPEIHTKEYAFKVNVAPYPVIDPTTNTAVSITTLELKIDTRGIVTFIREIGEPI